MFVEALNFAATYAITPRRHPGEIKSSVSLWARARRCATAWAAHEINCKTLVLDQLESLQQKRICVILGSGLLRDTPIIELSRQFREIHLYDLQHLASVRLWAGMKGLTNLHFMTQDLSGLDFALVSPDVEPLPLNFLKSNLEIDLVISANLLSQIGIGVSRALEDQNERGTIAQRLLQAHIDGLRNLSCHSILLTDTNYQIIARDGRVLEDIDLMHGAGLPVAMVEWSWPVAPYGELDPAYQAAHRVKAFGFTAL
jgi:hypothetical protein